MDRKNLDGGGYGGNDVGGVDGWGGAEGNGIPLDEDVNGGEHEDGDDYVPLRQQSPCVRVEVLSRAESDEVVPDPFPDNQKAVH